MSRYLVQNDGLFLGSSSACNLVTCVKLVRKLGWKGGQTIVTILYISIFLELYHDLQHVIRCDSGNRHYSKVCELLFCIRNVSEVCSYVTILTMYVFTQFW